MLLWLIVRYRKYHMTYYSGFLVAKISCFVSSTNKITKRNSKSATCIWTFYSCHSRKRHDVIEFQLRKPLTMIARYAAKLYKNNSLTGCLKQKTYPLPNVAEDDQYCTQALIDQIIMDYSSRTTIEMQFLMDERYHLPIYCHRIDNLYCLKLYVF